VRLTELNFSSKPYKWIRYATGIVVGAQGDLSSEHNSPDDVMNYDDDLTSTSTNLYYHVNSAERQKMFPTDDTARRARDLSERSCGGQRGSGATWKTRLGLGQGKL